MTCPDGRKAALHLAMSWVLGAVGIGCAAPAVRIDERGLAQHREEEAKERAIAAAQREAFDPYARTTRSSMEPVEPGLPLMDEPAGSNPTAWHLTEAAKHEAHAREHAAAASALEHFEASECIAIPARERSACPVLVSAIAIRDVERGVRVDFPPEGVVAQVAARMRCHLAYARSVGFDRAPECPLYMRGVDIRLSDDGHAIEVLGDHRTVVAEIRRRITQVTPSAR